MLAHPMWSLLRNLVDGEDTRAEYQSREQLHHIRFYERRGAMEEAEQLLAKATALETTATATMNAIVPVLTNALLEKLK